jgi:hypothetical protein
LNTQSKLNTQKGNQAMEIISEQANQLATLSGILGGLTLAVISVAYRAWFGRMAPLKIYRDCDNGFGANHNSRYDKCVSVYLKPSMIRRNST